MLLIHLSPHPPLGDDGAAVFIIGQLHSTCKNHISTERERRNNNHERLSSEPGSYEQDEIMPTFTILS